MRKSKILLGLVLALLMLFMPVTNANAAVSSTGSFADALLAIVPAYSGKPYVVINNNMPYFTGKDLTTRPFESYSELDSLGRCGTAYANVCKEIMPTEKRGEIGMIKPSGWQTVKYNGYIEGNYLYNRCHLIAYMLAGENANVKNLITGTRYLNANVMLTFENKVHDYINSHPDNHVLYRVTPVFAGNNLLASGVLMEAYSVEDNGSLRFCVYCYNVQPGFEINYANGKSQLVDASKCVTSSNFTTANNNNQQTNNQQITTTNQQPAVTGLYYIGNARNGKLHSSNCKNLPATKNRRVFATRQEAVNAGFTDACGNCHP